MYHIQLFRSTVHFVVNLCMTYLLCKKIQLIMAVNYNMMSEEMLPHFDNQPNPSLIDILDPYLNENELNLINQSPN